MPMVASVMASAIKSKMASVAPSAGAIAYQQAFGEALTQYLSTNMQITYSWVGILSGPVPTPDPVVSFPAQISWPVFLLTPMPEFVSWATLLTLQLQGGIITPTDPSFIIAPGVLGPIAPIMQPVGITDPVMALPALCQNIINSLLTAINPTPLPGIHLGFTGTPGAIMTLIS